MKAEAGKCFARYATSLSKMEKGMTIKFTSKGIHFHGRLRGCSAFYADLTHPFQRGRGMRLFCHQIISGIKLIRGNIKNDNPPQG